MEYALNPDLSIWVNASAGSGKTTLLVQRIISLILANKTNILCLTFTNNAVDEIKSRVHKSLESAAEKNAYLKNIMHDLNQVLNVCTIHSFCQNILENYCLEFSSLKINDDIQKKFYQYAISDYLEEEAIETSTTKELTEWRLNKIVKNLFPTYSNILVHKESLALIKNQLLQFKNDKHYFSNAYRQFESSEGLNNIEVKCIQALEKGKGIKEKELANLLKNKNFTKAFLNSEGEIRNISSIITKETMEKNQELFLSLRKIQSDYFKYYHDKAFNQIIEDSSKLLDVLHIICKRYFLYKKNYITYNDLIFKTLSLIREHHWVLFEIDKKIDHILVDEAQDNNANYWEIIYRICEEFFSGSSSENGSRTFFAVGDSKQSIYGFQGSHPQIFENIQKLFLAHNATNTWKIIELETCYRCSRNILEFVDKIFLGSTISKQDSFKNYTKHVPYREEKGKVELWPLEEDNSPIKLSIIIAKKIHLLINHTENKPSDIAILVRHKTEFLDLVMNELSNLGIKTNFSENLSIKNPILELLLSIGKFLLFSGDDLSLFKILSSGIMEITNEEIFLLCYKRDQTLYKTLYNEKLPIYYILEKWKKNMGNPFERYAQILYDELIQNKLITCFGNHVLEIVESFLESIMPYTSLIEFITDFEADVITIKSNIYPNAVTLSTIHKAKGMEFPVVILTDTTNIPKENDYEIIFTENGIPLWITNKNVAKILELKQNKQHKNYSEYLRLLYVALTRAKNELYICGWDKKSVPGSWYDIIYKATTH